MPSNKSKVKRFEPFASAVENGLVYIIESSFGDKATLNAFYKELEQFDGERSTSTKKDDIPDACASGFNFLTKAKVHTAPMLPEINSPTLIANRDKPF